MTQVVYKIRHKVSGLWKNGGSWSRWGKKGKVWNGLGPLKLHLNLFRGYDGIDWHSSVKSDVPNWEIVEFHQTVAEVKNTPVTALYETAK